MKPDSLRRLITSCPEGEHPWVEFKQNVWEPKEIGQNISGMANGALYHDKSFGYVIWGVTNERREIVGSDFRPSRAKSQGQDLELWLHQRVSPSHDFKFHELVLDEKPMAVMRVPRAKSGLVAWEGQRFIRLNDNTTSLRDRPEIEKHLWAKLDATPYERRPIAEGLSEKDVRELLDFQAVVTRLEMPPGARHELVLERLVQARVVVEDEGQYSIATFGALAFAKLLSRFDGLQRKAPRVIVWRGDRRTDGVKHEQEGKYGYALSFDSLVNYVMAVLPKTERIRGALREDIPMLPHRAVRELIANALIHQDLAVTGAGPMIDVFPDRLEISNPGAALIDPKRFIDHPPRSRNDSLARLMREIGVCEERGFGIDYVIEDAETHQLPAPEFQRMEDATRVIMLSQRSVDQMTATERVRACYQHACLQYVGHTYLTNGSLRKRLGLPDKRAYMASRIIQDAMDAGLIKDRDPSSTSKRHAAYVPFWV